MIYKVLALLAEIRAKRKAAGSTAAFLQRLLYLKRKGEFNGK